MTAIDYSTNASFEYLFYRRTKYETYFIRHRQINTFGDLLTLITLVVHVLDVLIAKQLASTDELDVEPEHAKSTYVTFQVTITAWLKTSSVSFPLSDHVT